MFNLAKSLPFACPSHIEAMIFWVVPPTILTHMWKLARFAITARALVELPTHPLCLTLSQFPLILMAIPFLFSAGTPHKLLGTLAHPYLTTALHLWGPSSPYTSRRTSTLLWSSTSPYAFNTVSMWLMKPGVHSGNSIACIPCEGLCPNNDVIDRLLFFFFFFFFIKSRQDHKLICIPLSRDPICNGSWVELAISITSHLTILS